MLVGGLGEGCFEPRPVAPAMPLMNVSSWPAKNVLSILPPNCNFDTTSYSNQPSQHGSKLIKHTRRRNFDADISLGNLSVIR